MKQIGGGINALPGCFSCLCRKNRQRAGTSKEQDTTHALVSDAAPD
jgi:hypothetical protein